MTSTLPQRPKPPAEVLSLLGLSQSDVVNVSKGSVNKFTTPDGPVWLKIVELDQNPLHRRFLRGLMNLVPVPVLARTKSGKGGDTLLKQAEQAEILRAAGFNTPDTLFVNQDFLITSDCGTSLIQMVGELREANKETRDQYEARFERVLNLATRELSRLHATGLAHGRPKMRDFAWKADNPGKIELSMDEIIDGEIFMFDLEERPWEIMPMHDAQARDIILWLADICQYDESKPYSDEAARILFENVSEQTARSLRNVLRTVALLAPGTRWLQMSPLRNREIGGGLGAYELLKKHLMLRKRRLEAHPVF